jgi:hypothetical protein
VQQKKISELAQPYKQQGYRNARRPFKKRLQSRSYTRKHPFSHGIHEKIKASKNSSDELVDKALYVENSEQYN